MIVPTDVHGDTDSPPQDIDGNPALPVGHHRYLP